MNIEITRVVILQGNGPDRVSLMTGFSCPFVRDFLPSQANLELDFQVSAGRGPAYVRDKLGLPEEITHIIKV